VRQGRFWRRPVLPTVRGIEMSLSRVCLLGTFRVERSDLGGAAVAIPEGRLRTLCATLALQPGRSVSMTEIAERLWDGAPPPSARTTIRGHVKRLRRALDAPGRPSVIMSGRHGYRLEIPPELVDLHLFRALTAQAMAAAGAEQQGGLLREALRLWRGAALCDVAGESLHREVVPLLRAQYLDALQRRIECDLRTGGSANVIVELTRLVAENPLHEAFWAQLMRALDGAGRPAEALAAYERCRAVLVERLGVDPGNRLRALHRRILIGEPVTPASVPAR
jgi:DNA-binding SARP family transcriptional activator